MKIKCSMVVLFVVALSCFTPGIAFGDTVVPDVVPAAEELSFSPLIYATILLAAVAASSVVVSMFFFQKFQDQQKLVCHNLNCQNNPEVLLGIEGVFDYRQMETPEEFLGNHDTQTSFAVAEAIGRLEESTLLAYGSAQQTRDVPTHMHAQTQDIAPQAPHTALPVSEEMRKPHQPRHQKKLTENETPILHIKFVPGMKHAKKRNAADAKPSVLNRESQAAGVPVELEQLVRKIG